MCDRDLLVNKFLLLSAICLASIFPQQAVMLINKFFVEILPIKKAIYLCIKKIDNSEKLERSTKICQLVRLILPSY